MPDLGHLGFMAVLFMRSGKVGPSGMGIAPLSYLEIEAFGRIEPGVAQDDMRLLREMSVAFVDWLHMGKDVFCEPPWDGGYSAK